MIQKYTFHVRCEDVGVAEAIMNRAQTLTHNKHFLLGAEMSWDMGHLTLILRVSGSDQWKCSGYARQIAKLLLARHSLIKGEAPSPVTVTTEKNLRALTLEQGRTVRDYPDRATRSARRRGSSAASV